MNAMVKYGHVITHTAKISNYVRKAYPGHPTGQEPHFAFGSVLSGELPEARNFKQQLMKLLEMNEDLHEKYLYQHFK